MNAGEFDDYWVQSPEAVEAPAETALPIDTIEDVDPLDLQLGVAELKTVPDALYEPLFGQPSGAPLHTYAILDAAKVQNLPELLEVSGLKHRCLFKGDAYDELKDVAPWIVQLEDGNAFTRNLFTRSDAPWHLWDAEPGIYIRSGGTLDDMWTHFRKFTKVQDESGKWFYFRFWEPDGFIETIQQESAAGLLGKDNGLTIIAAYVPTRETTHAISPRVIVRGASGKFTLHDDHRAAFDARIENRFTQDFAETLQKTAPNRMNVLGVTKREQVTATVATMVAYLKPFGFKKRSDIARMASCGLFYGTYFLSDPRVAPLAQQYLRNEKGTQGLKAKRFEEMLHQVIPLSIVAETKGLTHILPHVSYACDTSDPVQNWLPQLYTTALGFRHADTSRLFAQTCQEQQARHGMSDPAHQNAHYVVSAIYTPHFLDDPLHKTLRAIFAQQSDFKKALVADINRRIALLKES